MLRRVCLISTELAPLYGGGIGTYVLTMARAWVASGAEVHVITAAHEGLDELQQRLPKGIALHAVDRTRGLAPRLAPSSSALAHSAAAGDLLLDLHRQHDFDFIEFPDYQAEALVTLQRRAAGLADELAGVPIIIRLHSPSWEIRRYNEESGLSIEALMIEPLEEEAMGLTDAIASPSQRLATLVEERLPRLPPRHVVPYPFDAAAMADLGLDRGAESLPSNATPTILYTGRLERRKGVDTLIDAAIRLEKRGVTARWIFAGGDTPTAPDGGSMLRYLRERLADHAALADRTDFLGRLPRERLGPMLRAATLCCFPSRWENFPYACVEAMAVGAAVVGGSFGGMGELIEHGVNGFVARPDDAAALADVIASAVADRAALATIRLNATRRIAEICDPTRVVAAMEAIAKQSQPKSPVANRVPAEIDIVRISPDQTLSETLATLPAREWAILAARGDEPRDEFLNAARRVSAINPTAGFITAWSTASGESTHTQPIRPALGLNIDWCQATDPNPGGVALVDLARLRTAKLPQSLGVLPASPRLVAAIAASAGIECAVIPQPLIARGATMNAPARATETARLIQCFSGTSPHPGRAHHLLIALAAEHGTESDRIETLVAHAARVDAWARHSDAEARAFWQETQTLRDLLQQREDHLRDVTTAAHKANEAHAAELESLRRAVSSALSDANALHAELTAARAHAADAQARLDTLRHHASCTESDLRAAAVQIEASARDLAKSLATSRAERSRLARDLDAKRAEIRELETAIASLRYRVADRVNDALKLVHVQGAVRAIASRLARQPEPTSHTEHQEPTRS